MKLLFYVLNKTEKLDALLTEFTHRNIHGATVLESVGMARVLSHQHDADEIPFLGSIRAFLNPEKEKGNVIFTVIKDEQLTDAISAIEYVVGDLSLKDNGVAFCVPIDYTKGFCEIGD
jgi:hypothetical protein